ncbi:MAG: glucan biosynthesis protein D [Deltaproteobacteria bacterium HGW-Deltaproteobacteria-21]|nr:MAG: glucan biosynthesis protein D [Deltaproteobacteria bacterium HGW-Deltaproteobacteria-21]
MDDDISLTTECRANGPSQKGSNSSSRAPAKFLGAVICLFVIFSLLLEGEAKSKFVFQTVIDKAKQLAEKPFQSPPQVPEFLVKMSYDDWRDIRFDSEQAMWRKEKLPFAVQFFHPGLYYDRAVAINVVDPSGEHNVPFSTDMFNYGRNNFKDKIPPDLGFAGFRIHYPINTPDYYDEVAVFLGASYFRAVAKNQNYGMSSRGLAIDTALSTGEEFPYFKEFWLLKPAPGANKMVVYALLDSASVTGAYSYTIQPGVETTMDVKSVLFFRKKVEKLGIAPQTSMFFYSETASQRPLDDFRPEVHDSDGLLVATGHGEWIWRPLRNPRTLQIQSFQTQNPVGFGLLQRDQVFDHYQDLESKYETRPSLWVSPAGNWGEGRVELIQIPTEGEVNDNIISMWVPANVPSKGESANYSYKLSWHFPNGGRPPGGRVASTRIAKGKGEKVRKFVIDFEGGRLDSLPADAALTAVISVDSRAKLIEQQLYKNRVTKGWRLVFQVSFEEPGSIDRVMPPGKRPSSELRAFLKLAESALTETWSYAYQP